MTTTTPFSFRRINLNGSSVDTLIDDHRAALRSLNVAIEKFVCIRAHGRDFQTQPYEAFQQASAEFEQRLANLHDCAKFLEAHLYDLYDQKR